ncbi:acyl-CoA dehydrogenase family protein [Nocardia sp. BMG111209]|uniref:acyl-CoA dehydrogenase family protein n=1 Tax=Nocardia sp. BMG111209 TaxID=1160137 RepID=UPI00035FE333|nr:acyl-CoA dehydrogenase family protein [Nocardia sp. BMG111209]
MTELESVEEFRDRARRWLKDNLPAATGRYSGPENDDVWDRSRQLQRILFDGGFAGICYPKEYGGQGLTTAHQRAFTEESFEYEMPLVFNIPTLSICAPTILDLGTEDQKHKHLTGVLRGDQLLVQFLSEPRGGSDLAGLTTRADRDGDEWVLNGSKIWSSGAYAADYGICLARTNWDAPKHEGLTLFLVPVHAPGVTIQRIKQVTGSTEFCQEFFDDVRLPADSVLGEVNGGWAAASRLLFHERSAMGGTSPYMSGSRPRLSVDLSELVELARSVGRLDDPSVREDIGEARAMFRVRDQLVARVSRQLASGELPPPASSIVRLFSAENAQFQIDKAIRIAGASAATAAPDGTGRQLGIDYLFRNSWSLAGGSAEMSRNVISERLLGMPREFAADRGVPFNQVKHGR